MDLEYKIKDASGRPQVVRVEFDPPLRGYEEVKPRLLGMKADADEALGTVRDRSPRSLFPLPFSPRRPLPFPRARQRRRLCHVIRSYPARAIYTGQSKAP